MSVERFDLVITGSGFAGSIMAMIARRLGYSVLLLEKGAHPRFVIGESSTPLTNLLLERIAIDYDLPRLLPLTKWGAWQENYPEVGCGLKRGFSFFHHRRGEEFLRTQNHENELLVAASPHDRIADTHWYRPDFDHFLVKEAQALEVDFRDRMEVDEFTVEESYVELKGRREGTGFVVQAHQLIDASGPNGFLREHLKITTAEKSPMPATEGLYTHFRNVERLDNLPEFAGTSAAPYAQDDSAVHHCFEGGWIWVLRFNNGITSAGVSARSNLAAEWNLAEGEGAWKRLLERHPSIRRQFQKAQAILPFRHHKPLAFRMDQISSKNWLMLPSAFGFVDPLLSTGFPLTLLGVLRVAEMLKKREMHYVPSLENYYAATSQDFQAVEFLIAALFKNLGDPEKFRWLSHLYFAPMLFCESATRLGKRSATAGFMMRDDPRFWLEAKSLLHDEIEGNCSIDQLKQRVAGVIEPYDLGGLSEASRMNWHPADSKIVIRNAHKLGTTQEEMAEMLKRAGA